MLIASWHPTYAFYHNPYEWGAFEVDIRRFGRLIRGELRKPPKLVTERPTAADMKWFTRQPWVSCDIETAPCNDTEPWTGKDPTRCFLNLISIGTEEKSVSFRWNERPDLHAITKKILTDKKIIKVWQNGFWFDLRVLRRYGIDCNPNEDTRDARRALSSTSALSLDYLGSLYDDVHQWKAAKDFNNKVYNATDTVVTARTWWGETHEEEWNTPRVQRLYKLHKQLSQIAAEMHTTGFKVDAQMREWMAWALQQEFEEKRAAVVEKVGVPGFNGTPDHLRAIFFQRHERTTKPKRKADQSYRLAKFGLPDPIDPIMWTDEDRMDKISVDEDALIHLLIDPEVPQEMKEIIDLYWAAQSVQKQRGTFVTSEKVSHAIGTDGRLRAGWNSCGTDTGRWSCSEPNLMQVEQLLRSMYIAGKGNVLVHADWSQLEIRVRMLVAQDDMLEKFLSTGDLYTAAAINYFDLPKDTTKKSIKKEARQAAKIIELGSQYAAGTGAVYGQALKQDRTLTYSKIQLLHSAWKKTYVRTVQYWGEEMARVLKQGYSESRILHRRRVYPREPPITEVANYPIQSTAADLANLAIIKLHAQLKKHVPQARIITQIHDAFDVECPQSKQGDVTRILEDVMQEPVEIEGRKYSFPVEIKASTCWGDL
jgi:DNA polymerase I-like protein with 3'-5' exonuclease and polymerase domains